MMYSKRYQAISLAIISVFAFCKNVQALQGGPVMPEYVQFEPYDAVDIINMSTGDLAYTVPLGEVPGPAGSYPLAMSYHSGIKHQQEATWVGLGWTLNPGAINRHLRSFPDDIYKGMMLNYTYLRKSEAGWEVAVGAGWGPFGLNMTYDNNDSFGGSAILGWQIGPVMVGMEIGKDGSFGLSSEMGPFRIKADATGVSGSVSLGAPIGNSKMDLGASMGVHVPWSGKATTSANIGLSSSFPGVGKQSLFSLSANSAAGASVGIAGAGFSSISTSSGGVSFDQDVSGFGITIPILNTGAWVSIGFQHYRNTWEKRDGTIDFKQGYMYQGGKGIKIESINNLLASQPLAKIGTADRSFLNPLSFKFSKIKNTMEVLDVANSFPEKDEHKKYYMTAPSYDVFSVAGQGIGGSFRPYSMSSFTMIQAELEGGEIHNYVFNPRRNSKGHMVWNDNVFYRDLTNKDLISLGEHLIPRHLKNYSYCYGVEAENMHSSGYLDLYNENEINENMIGEKGYVKKALDGGCSPYALVKSNYLNEANRLLITPDDENRYRQTSQSNMRFGFINENGKKGFVKFWNNAKDTSYFQFGGGRQVIPLLEENREDGRIAGFKIVDADGKQYYYKQPVMSLLTVDYVHNKEQGMPKFTKGNKFFSWNVQPNPYATQWLLTEIRGADFIEMNEVLPGHGDYDMSKNYGYQVRFNYLAPITYSWRSPYARPNKDMEKLPNMKVGKERYIASFGQKELIYLESIETATHKACFKLNKANDPRLDMRPWVTKWFKKEDMEPGYNLEVPVYLTYGIVENSTEYKGNQRYDFTFLPHDYNSYPNGFYGFEADDNKYTGIHYELWKYYAEFELKYITLPFVLTEKMKHNLDGKSIEISGFDQYFFRQAKIWGSNRLYSGPRFKIDEKSYTIEEVVNSPLEDESGRTRIYVSGATAEPVTIREGLAIPIRGRPHPTAAQVEKIYEEKVHIGPNGWFTMADGEGGTFQAPFIPRKDQTLPLWGGMKDIYDLANDDKPVARKLKEIQVVKKSNNQLLNRVKFEYDYRLCKYTPNSYDGTYPTESRNLKGKLTLKKITQIGVDLQTNGEIEAPSWEFEYQGGVDGNPDYQDWPDRTDDDNAESEFIKKLIASNYRTDEWGMFNPDGTRENQKINNSNNLGVSWNLTKVVNPLGGVLQLEYERDEANIPAFNYINGDKGYAFKICDSDGKLVTELPKWPEGGLKAFTYYYKNPQMDPNDLMPESQASEIESRYELITNTPGDEDLKAGDRVLVVMTYFSSARREIGTRCKRTRIHRWMYDTFIAQIDGKTSNSILLNVKYSSDKKKSDLPTKDELMKKMQNELPYPDEHLCSKNSNPRFVGIIKLEKAKNYAGGIRIRSMKSCFRDCSETRYYYENGNVALMPDDVISERWLYDNRYLDILYDGKANFKNRELILDHIYGKNMVGTPGGNYDNAFLPSGGVIYGKVTVKNVEEGTDNSINGKTVYSFWTAGDFNSSELPITDEKTMWNSTYVSYPGNKSLDYHKGEFYVDDKTGIIGKPKSISYYGQIDYDTYYLVKRDSTEYRFSDEILGTEDWKYTEMWGSFKYAVKNPKDEWGYIMRRIADEFGSWTKEQLERNVSDFIFPTGSHPIVMNLWHRSYPVLVTNQISYQTTEKVNGEDDIGDINHLKTVTSYKDFDELTGVPKTTNSTFKTVEDVEKRKESTYRFVRELSDREIPSVTEPRHLIPREMKHRNLLSQKLDEREAIYTGSNEEMDSLLSYKFFKWKFEHFGLLNGKGMFVKTAEMYPEFDIVPWTETPEDYYNSDYDFTKKDWRFSEITKINKYSKPMEIVSSDGRVVSSQYDAEDNNLIGYSINSYYDETKTLVNDGYPKKKVLLNDRFVEKKAYVIGDYSIRNGNIFIDNSTGPFSSVVWIPFFGTENTQYNLTFRAKEIAGRQIRIGIYSGQEFDERLVTLTTQMADYELTLAFGNANVQPQESFIRIASTNDNDARYLIDLIKIKKVTGNSYQVLNLGGSWKMTHYGYEAVSNPTALYALDAPMTLSELVTPLKLNCSDATHYVIELKARANVDGTSLHIDFVSTFPSWTEGDQKTITLKKSWDEYRVVLDKRVGYTQSQYGHNILRLFNDLIGEAGAEIEIQYVRVYPKSPEILVNTFMYDDRGKIIELIDENQIPYKFEYDAFGKLIVKRDVNGTILSEERLNYGN